MQCATRLTSVLCFAALTFAPLRADARQRDSVPRAATQAATARQEVAWPIKSREHADLWLHGFAMVSDDSSVVPLFQRGYKAFATRARNKANAFTELDANRDMLAKALKEHPALVNAQFLPLYFRDWPELDAALTLLVKSNGNPRAASNQQETAILQMLDALFPSKDERDFARRLQTALRSEQEKFFHAWWLAETRRRDRALERADSLWQKVHRPKLQNFLNNTQQSNGEVWLALSLEGEGRTVNGGKQQNIIAVGFPDSASNALDVVFALAHEMVGSLTTASVDDNTTPAEKRSGGAARLQSIANVRAGALLMAHLSPELATGYARFYLRASGVKYEGDAMAAFVKAFPVPPGMLESIERQIAVAFGGI